MPARMPRASPRRNAPSRSSTRRGGIAGSSAEPRGRRDAFDQPKPGAVADAALLPEQRHGTHHKVLGPRRHVANPTRLGAPRARHRAATKLQPIVVDFVKEQRIIEPHRRHERFDLVEPVGPLAEHFEEEIDLRRGLDDNTLAVLVQVHLTVSLGQAIDASPHGNPYVVARPGPASAASATRAAPPAGTRDVLLPDCRPRKIMSAELLFPTRRRDCNPQ